jgi:hypothetical protein
MVPDFGVDVKEDVLADGGAAGVTVSGSESSKGEL